MAPKSSQICFVINSTKVNKIKFENEVKALFSSYSVKYKYTTKKGHAIELAKEGIVGGCEFLLAVGGDGTINEVINGYMLTDENVRKATTIGLLPKGTGNDFTRSLFGKNKLGYLLHAIDNNKFINSDVGEISYVGKEGLADKRFFINIADVGIGANAVRLVDNSSKVLGSSLTFVLAILRSFLGFKHLNLKLISNDFNYEGKVVTICFANGKWFGSGLGIAPHAKLTDGKIALSIAGEIKMRTFLAKLPILKKMKFIKHDKVIYKTVESCRIEPIGQDCPLEADGEFLGFLPAEVKMHKQVVKFLVGADYVE